jgi:TetR/AcrR family transcriptional regulator, tetracycline repressor protein
VARARYVAPVLSYGALDRAHLTKHLLALARDVGVDKVTMRGLAAHAGTSASSVYYHVKDKGELLDLLIDTVVRSIQIPTRGNWEQRLTELYTNAWRVLISVPGIAALLQQRPYTEAANNMNQASSEILHGSGLPAEQYGAAHAVLYIHLLGSVELGHRLRPHARPEAHEMEAVFTYGLNVILAGLKADR